MYQELVLLNIFIAIVVSASYNVLIADDKGIHILDTKNEKNLTLLPHIYGSNCVTYHFARGEIYGILKNLHQKEFMIVRTKISDAQNNASCGEVEQWCRRSSCHEICNSSNPYVPKLVLKPSNCLRANNLVVDWVNNNLYWTCDPTDNLESTLNMVAVDGSNQKTIYSTNRPIQSVELDPLEKTLFILESNNVLRTNLHGENPNSIYQFGSHNKTVMKLSLDAQNKILYVVWNVRNTSDRILACLSYGGKEVSDLEELYKCKDPGWELGPKMLNGVVHWFAHTEDEWQTVNESKNIKIKMEKISANIPINQWSLVHPDSQKLVNNSYCTIEGCSHDCIYSSWMKIKCHCPSGMNLEEDNKTCHSSPETTVSEQSAGLAHSASHNATGTPGVGVVTACSSNMTLLHVVLATIVIAVFIVAVLLRRRAKMGNYEPPTSRERMDFSL